MTTMTLDEYKKLALRTENTPICVRKLFDSNLDERSVARVMHAILGISTEVRELEEATVGCLASGAWNIDMPNVFEECGDIFWYVAVGLDACGVGFDAIAPYGIDDSRIVVTPTMLFHALSRNAGSLEDKLKRALMYRKSVDSHEIVVLLGHAFHGTVMIVKSLGGDPMTVCAANIAKLQRRFPEKFTETLAVERDLAGERAVLEQHLSKG